MRRLITLLPLAAVAATLLPVSADAAGRHRQRVVYEEAYAAEPVYAASAVPLHPLAFPLIGAGVGAIIGAAVCPPCAIAGSALTSGGGALVGAGIGAVGGTVVGIAATPYYRY